MLVPADECHLDEEGRVVAVRLDDQCRAAGLQYATVLGERTQRIVHVVERVLGVEEVEGGVLEWEPLAVGNAEAEPGLVQPVW